MIYEDRIKSSSSIEALDACASAPDASKTAADEAKSTADAANADVLALAGETGEVIKQESAPTGSYKGITPADVTGFANHKYYASAKMSAHPPSGQYVIRIYNRPDTWDSVIAASSSSAGERFSNVINVPWNFSGPTAVRIEAAVESDKTAFVTIYDKSLTLIDLTAAFGAGNEPTAAEMDAMLSAFPNGWFDGTVQAVRRGSLVAGTNVTLTGNTANRLLGAGDVTINATGLSLDRPDSLSGHTSLSAIMTQMSALGACEKYISGVVSTALTDRSTMPSDIDGPFIIRNKIPNSNQTWEIQAVQSGRLWRYMPNASPVPSPLKRKSWILADYPKLLWTSGIPGLTGNDAQLSMVGPLFGDLSSLDELDRIPLDIQVDVVGGTEMTTATSVHCANSASDGSPKFTCYAYYLLNDSSGRSIQQISSNFKLETGMIYRCCFLSSTNPINSTGSAILAILENGVNSSRPIP